MSDPQSGLDADPGREPDTQDDPAHGADEDEGWEYEGGAAPEGPATDA